MRTLRSGNGPEFGSVTMPHRITNRRFVSRVWPTNLHRSQSDWRFSALAAVLLRAVRRDPSTPSWFQDHRESCSHHHVLSHGFTSCHHRDVISRDERTSSATDAPRSDALVSARACFSSHSRVIMCHESWIRKSCRGDVLEDRPSTRSWGGGLLLVVHKRRLWIPLDCLWSATWRARTPLRFEPKYR